MDNTLTGILKRGLTAGALVGALSCFPTEPSRPLACEGECTVHLCSFNGIPVLEDKFSPNKSTVAYGLEIEADSIVKKGNLFDRYLHQMVRAIKDDKVDGMIILSPMGIRNGEVQRSGDSIYLTQDDWFKMYGVQNPDGLTLKQDPLYGVAGADTIVFHDGEGVFEYRTSCHSASNFRLP